MQSPGSHIATTPLILGLGEIKANPAGIFFLCTHLPPPPSLFLSLPSSIHPHTPTAIILHFSLHYSKEKEKNVSPLLFLLLLLLEGRHVGPQTRTSAIPHYHVLTFSYSNSYTGTVHPYQVHLSGTPRKRRKGHGMRSTTRFHTSAS